MLSIMAIKKKMKMRKLAVKFKYKKAPINRGFLTR
jgi:hypothetical protein